MTRNGSTRFASFLAAVVLGVGALDGAPDAPAQAIASKIDAVTVYLDRALVTRTASLKAAPGLQSVVFKGLSPEIDDASLRLRILGDARLEFLKSERIFLAQHDEESVRKLEGEVKELAERVQEQRDILAALEGGASFLSAIHVAKTERISNALGREEGKGPDVADFRAVLAFLTDERVATAAKAREARKRLSELEPRLSARQKEFNEARANARLEQKEIHVTLRSEKGGDVTLHLSYLLPGATWFPSYDARSDAERTALELSAFAVIQQATGERWEGAVITLSAARPAVQVKVPEIAPWFLSAAGAQHLQQTDENRSQSWDPGQNLQQQYSSRGKGQKEAHNRLLENVFQVKLVSESVEKRSTSGVFPLARRETVECDGRPHRAPLGTYQIPVQKAYSAVPRISLNTYVTGRFMNMTPMPLLPGTVNVFIGADLIGSSSLDFIAPRESAEIYLGVEEGIKLTRELDAQKSSRSFFSDLKQVEAAFVITVQNLRTAPATVAIHEALPVSQDAKVRVRVQELEPKPKEMERGLARWELTLPPGETRRIGFAYSIEHPESIAIAEIAGFENQLKIKK